MPNEFRTSRTTRIKKTTGMNAGPDLKQHRDDHTRETHIWRHEPGLSTHLWKRMYDQRAPPYNTSGPRPMSTGTRRNTRLETRTLKTHVYTYTCDACLHLYMRRGFTLDMQRGFARAYMKTRVCITLARRTCVHPHRSLVLHLPIRDFATR